MISYQVKIDSNTLTKLQTAFEQSAEIASRHIMQATNQSLIALQGTARELAPIRDGVLQSSIQVLPARREGNRIEGSVSTNLNYAEAQEAGSGIYGPSGQPIRPRRAKVLAWKSGNTWHFAKSVKGVRPRWYMRGSVEQNQSRIDGYYATAAENIARELAGGAR